VAKPFHLAWFGNFTVPNWNDPFGGNDPLLWMNGDFYIDMARSLERAGFDYFMIEDSLMVPDTYRGTAELELKYALYSPKHDPMPLVPLLARATKHLGIVATASTSFYPPFMLARLMTTLDHLTDGRVGWNIVTSSEDLAAQNFGMESLPDHDLRYDMAEEYVELVRQLWDSWDADAVVMDRTTGVYADYTKVRPIHFRGKYHSSRGPLNTLRGPQGRPVFCQAGGSPRGRSFAAKNTDTLLAIPNGIAEMKAYRDDVRALAMTFERDPDDIKVMFVIRPVLGATQDEAEAKRRAQWEAHERNLEIQFVHMSALMEIDMSQFELDEILPEDLATNGHQSSLATFLRINRGKTLREAVSKPRIASIELVGTPDAVASQMAEAMEEVGGDGFLLSGFPVSRRYLNEVCEGLVPELQRRGLTRTRYDHTLLRDNLLAF
jgi:FMN-dependent oxidoreductase (nitrilotriacetate monooxygenase family)